MEWKNVSAGDAVHISTKDGEYQGVVHVYDEPSGRLLLNKVIGNGQKFSGVQCFFDTEISKVVVIKQKKHVIDEPIAAKRNTNSIELSKMLPINVGNDKSEVNVSLETENLEVKKKIESVKIIIFDEPKENFHVVVQHINKQSQIGLGLEGVNICRDGKLCWLQISTAKHVLLFDMLHCSSFFFQEGLKSILEDSSIVKVVHDCRPISDCLYHCFGIQLRNVFDTQVADVLVYKLLNVGKLPRHTKILSSCLLDYLDLDKEDVYVPSTKMTYCIDDQQIWKKKPLPQNLIDAAVKNVLYLVDLMAALKKKMSLELDFATNIFLSSMRDAHEHEIALMSSNSLPSTFEASLNEACREHARQEIFKNETKRDQIDSCVFKNKRVLVPKQRIDSHNSRHINAGNQSNHVDSGIVKSLNFKPIYENIKSNLNCGDHCGVENNHVHSHHVDIGNTLINGEVEVGANDPDRNKGDYLDSQNEDIENECATHPMENLNLDAPPKQQSRAFYMPAGINMSRSLSEKTMRNAVAVSTRISNS